ncbi:MAG: type II toxin-antitoxin system death-on-curing family toxin [Bacillota bacterium]
MRYLTGKEIILLNSLLIKRYSPNEMVGVKDYSLLMSAVERPKQTVFKSEAYPTIWTKAAALYSSIAQNHAFFNANKRTAFASMKQFLWMNGYRFCINQREAEDYTVNIVVEKFEINDIAIWIKNHSVMRE